ncbi:HEAT repeat [anaerobic digester metagenome]
MGLYDLIAGLFVPERRVTYLRGRGDSAGLVRLLTRGEPAVRHLAAAALGELRDPVALPALVAALQGPDEEGVRWRAAEALVKLGSCALDNLIVLAAHDDPDVRWKACVSLGEIGDVRAAPALVDRLADHDRFVRTRAVSALVRLGSPALPLLTIALEDPDVRVRVGAADVLGQIGDAAAIEGLLIAIKDPVESVRRSAAVALLRLNPVT